ncbi:MAG: hypothetical protein V4683_01215 [Bacteroidota bacterium]
MDSKELNNALVELLDKRNQLSKLQYSDETYDVVEEELHDMEDDFTDKFGDYLEKAITKVHREFCSETDVLLATSYLPKVVKKVGDEYEFTANEGVLVEMDDLPALEARLLLLPSPPRMLLLTPGETMEVWKMDV